MLVAVLCLSNTCNSPHAPTPDHGDSHHLREYSRGGGKSPARGRRVEDVASTHQRVERCGMMGTAQPKIINDPMATVMIHFFTIRTRLFWFR